MTVVRWGRALGALLAVLVVGLAWLGPAALPAHAHTALHGTDPTDASSVDGLPDRLTLTFTANLPPGAGTARVEVVDEADASLAAGEPTVDGRTVTQALAGNPTGRVDVRWRVVSADGHPVTGQFSFTVTPLPEPTPLPASVEPTPLAVAPATTPVAAAPAPTTAAGPAPSPPLPAPPAGPDPWLTSLSIVLYAGALVFAGTTIFEALIAQRRVPGLRGGTLIAGVVAIASATLLVPYNALVTLGREPGDLTRLGVWGSSALWPSLVVALMVWVGVVGMLLISPPGEPAGPVSALFAAAVAVAPVQTGHSATLDPAALRLVDVVHLLAASVWVGGLVALLVLFLPRATGAAPEGPVEAAHTLERFSRWALGTVVVLAASGVGLVLASVGSPAALVSTPWGLSLIAKLALVAVTVGLAALNRFVVVPRIQNQPTDAAAWALLRRFARGEALLLVGVLIATGVLTNTDSGLHAGH